MASAGTIVVELQANTAQFHQEMGRAGAALHEVGEGASRGERRLVSFAARGIGVVVPEAEGAAHALLGLVESASKASGAFALLAKAGLLGGVAIGAFLVGQKLREEIDNWLQLGETSKQTLDRLSKELEENTKFLEKRSAAVNLAIALEGKLAVARANANAAATKSLTGEDTTASLGAALEARLAAIDTAQTLEEANIRKTIALGVQRDRALLASQMAGQADRFAATADFYSKVGKLAEDASKKERELFQKDTTLLLDALKSRLDLRKQLEANAASLVESGTIIDPLGSPEKTSLEFRNVAEGFALLLDKGRPWRDLQDQIFAKDAEFQSKGFPGFASAVQDAGQRMQSLGITGASIDAQWFSLSKRLGDDMPAAIDRADPAIRGLIQRFQEMRIEADRATASVAQLANAIASGGNAPTPEVTAPVDLGVNP